MIAICDIDLAKARDLASRWAIPHVYNNLDDIFEEKSCNDIQIIDICTPPFTHVSLVKTALESGRHVLCEKPLCFTTEEATKIGESVRGDGPILEIVRSAIYHPVVMRVKERLSKQHTGDVIHMNIEWLHTPQEPMAINGKHWTHSIQGGKLAETIPHIVALTHYFMGNFEIDHVLPTKAGTYPWMRSDELNLLLKSSKATCSAYLSFNAPVESLTVTLFCQHEVFRIDLIGQVMKKIGYKFEATNRFSRLESLIGHTTDYFGEIFKTGILKLFGRENTPFYNQVSKFVEAIRRNDRISYPWEQCYNEVKLQETIAQAIDSKSKKTD